MALERRPVITRVHTLHYYINNAHNLIAAIWSRRSLVATREARTGVNRDDVDGLAYVKDERRRTVEQPIEVSQRRPQNIF